MKLNERNEILDEVRAARDTYAARFDYSIRRMVEDLKQKEAQHPELLAKLLPRDPKAARVQAE